MRDYRREESIERTGAVELRELRHEIGNALTAASAHVQFLLRRLPVWAEMRDGDSLEAIRDSHRRVRDLLHPAPVGFPATRCDLRVLAALAVSQVPPDRSTDLLVNVRAETPPIACGHPERIVQVLANLLDNAVKYSPPGTPIELETYWLSETMQDWVLIVVSDQGIGIATEVLDAIFAGYRTADACQSAPGSGLGLELSRRLIEQEGGQLWAQARPGAGSAFYIKLPAAIVGTATCASGDPRISCDGSLGASTAIVPVTPAGEPAAMV